MVFLQRVGADLRIVRGKCTVPKDGVKKQGNSGHRNDEFVFGTGLFELAHNRVAFRRSGVDRHQIIVVKVDPPSSHFAQHIGDFDRGNDRANEITKWIASPIPQRPEPEGKFVTRLWLVSIIVRH